MINGDPMVTLSEDRSREIERRVRLLRWGFVALTVMVLVLSLIMHRWQQFAVAGLSGLGALLTAWAHGRIRRGRHGLGLAVVAVVGLAFGVSLLWHGLASWLAVLLGGTLLFLTLSLGRGKGRYALGAFALVAVGLLLVLADQPLPWSRYDVNESLLTAITTRVLLSGLTVSLALSFARLYGRMTALRTRLTVTLVLVVLGVTAIVTVTSIWMGTATAGRRTLDQLQATVRLQEEMTEAWLDQLTFALDSLVVEDYEVQRAQSLLLESLTKEYRLAAAHALRVRFKSVIKRTGWFTEIFLINPDGYVALSTEPELEGRYVGDKSYYELGLSEHVISEAHYDPEVGSLSIVLARPLQVGSFTYGVLATRADMTQLTKIADVGAAGRTGVSYFVGADNRVLASSDKAALGISVVSPATRAAVRGHVHLGRGRYQNHMGVPVVGVYTWIPRLHAGLVNEMERSEMLASARAVTLVNGGVAIAATLTAVVLAMVFSRSFSRPLAALAETASEIAAGNLELEAPVVRNDEVGAVARAFNAMTAQLRDLVATLEARVRARTRGLQAVAEVSRATTSILDLERLLPQVVNLVRQRFDLYYVGLFLLDDEGKYAVLRAGTGDAGAEMLAAGWRLEVGGDSMIGQCVALGQPQVKQQEGDEVIQLANPFLPETRSEMALPLRYGDRVIGAMTIQSTVERAFGETEMAVFQNLADQVAVAVQNARLFAETQAALDRAQRIQQRYLIQAWGEYLQMQRTKGYEHREGHVVPLNDELLPEVQEGLRSTGPTVEGNLLRVPLRQAGRVIGVLGVERRDGWTNSQVALVETLVEQLVLAAENQRLLDDITRRAALERTIGEVTATVRQEVEIESVLEQALAALGDVLGADKGAVWISLTDGGGGKRA